MSNSATAEATPITEAAQPASAKVGVGAILVPVLLSTVLTLSVVGGGGYYLLRSGKLNPGGAAAAAVPAKPVPPPVTPSHVLALEPMIVNLSDDGGRSYLRAAISLRVREDETKEGHKEEKKDPKAPDTVATELRDTTLAVLSRQTSDGLLAPDGRERLKQALEQAFKEHNAEVPVLEVYFTDFLVQRG